MKNLKNSFKITQLLYLIVVLGIFSAINLFSMRMTTKEKIQAKKFLEKQGLLTKKEAETRNLLIFLDDSERDLGTIGNMLIVGLLMKKCPIIASTSLLYAVREETKKDMRSIDELFNELIVTLETANYEKFKKKNSILVSRVIFIEENWIIKKINDSLVLLIPKFFLEELSISNDQVEQYDKNLELSSEVELKLGLKVNHMETIALEHINKPQEISIIKLLFNGLLVDYFIDVMDSIFCTKSDYRIVESKSPEWIIYIEGHGLLNTQIVGLGLNDFQQFLSFLEHKIKTQLLMYVSCFAVGVNSDKIFGNMKSQAKEQYSFPIIVRGINDAIGSDQFPNINIFEWVQNKKIVVDYSPDFPFEIAKNIKEGKFKHLFSSAKVLYNLPQIKLPGIDWLSVDIADNEIVSIGSILTKTHDFQKPLNIVSFFKKDPEIILLYADNIPFELLINSQNLKTIFSMMSSGSLSNAPGYIVHKIKKISSTTHDFIGILRWFILTGISQGNKWFLIDEIGDKKDILIYGTHDYATKFYYKDHNNDLFMAEIKNVINLHDLMKEPILFNKVENGSEDEKKYNQRMMVQYTSPFEKYIYPWFSQKTTTEISPEQIKKIENIYPEQKGKQEYEEIEKLYPNAPSWWRSSLIWWKYGK
ncbi:MAG TPA: hypothetical protein VHX42_00035 [Candidatus Babeliales bacterium]|nr:hypothetical protein [Candidatus Babeliales bacterium]